MSQVPQNKLQIEPLMFTEMSLLAMPTNSLDVLSLSLGVYSTLSPQQLDTINFVSTIVSIPLRSISSDSTFLFVGIIVSF